MASLAAIVPVTLKAARRFVALHHRHHRPPTGGLFAVGLGDPLVAVAIVGVASARGFAPPTPVEVTRLCSTAPVEVNASSRLYAACAAAALAIGYQRVITYTRADEPGTSLRAANFRPTARVEPDAWDRRRRLFLPGLYAPSTDSVARVRWEIGPAAAPELEQLRQFGRRQRSAA
jgi:hypothetical protein